MGVRVVLALTFLATAVAADDKKPEPSDGKPDDFVEITEVIDDVVLDIHYATKDNFTGEAVYPKAVCKLRRGVAERLAKAATTLRKQDRRLLIWDCYRPLSIQKIFWKLVPDPKYVADPKQGSRHNRGAAVDLAIVDKDGNAVTLPTKFDEFSKAAHRSNALAGKNGVEAKRLSKAMTDAGFAPMPTEWWHFDAPDSAKYAIADDPL